jgi:hypothetical protein
MPAPLAARGARCRSDWRKAAGRPGIGEAPAETRLMPGSRPYPRTATRSSVRFTSESERAIPSSGRRVHARTAEKAPASQLSSPPSSGGLNCPGEPGSREFIAAYSSAVAAKVTPPACVLLAVLMNYQQSDDFRQLADRTRRDYVAHIAGIEREFGTLPLAALSDRRKRDVFMAWVFLNRAAVSSSV